MFYSSNEVLQYVRENDVKFIRLAFCDICGTLKNIAIMADELPRAFECGVPFDAGLVRGFAGSTPADMVLHPDASTLEVLPWRPQTGRVARFYCSITDSAGRPFAQDSRLLLRNAAERAAQKGFTFRFGAKCEFYLFRLDENGDPDFSHRQELPQEPIDATRQVYIAWNQLVTNENLSAEERYAYRRDVFTNLPDMDWQEFGALGGIDSSGTIFALLDWLSQQEHYSSGDIYFIQRGYAARGIDGAYAEDYCYLLSRALFSDPVAYAKALARSTADDEAVQTLIMGGTAYGADYYPADCETAVSALDAAINANALTAEETGWAKLLRYYLVNPNSGYYADYPKTPAELEN